MSSFLYPNSATRKLFGQAGKAMQRQNKRFMDYQQREREKRIKDITETERTASERASAEFKRIQRKERITIAVIAGVIIISFAIYLIFF